MTLARTLIVVAVAGLAALALVRGVPAGSMIDVTGDWTFRITGDFGPFGSELTLHCTAPLVQTGDDVSGDFECGVANGSATATLTPQTQGATIDADVHIDLSSPFSDVDAHVVGTVAPHGNYMEGTWEAPSEDLEGTWDATRDVARFLKGDVNCDGVVNALDGLTQVLHRAEAEIFQFTGCPGIEEEFASIFGDMNCDDQVTELDALFILRHAAGLPEPQLVGCAGVGAMIVEAAG